MTLIKSANELSFRYSKDNDPVMFRFFNAGEGQIIVSICKKYSVVVDKLLANKQLDIFAFKPEITADVQNYCIHNQLQIIYLVNKFLTLSSNDDFKSLNSIEKYHALKEAILIDNDFKIIDETTTQHIIDNIFKFWKINASLTKESIIKVFNDIDSEKIYI